MTVGTRCILMTTFDLLEGLLSLTEKDYSENSYVIHAVSKVLDLLFTYSKWPLKRAWSEQTNKSSQSKKNRIGSINLGKKPDLQVLLKLDMKSNELVLVEISRLFLEQDKEDTSSRARLIHCELEKIPVLGIQVVEEFLRGSLRLRAIVEEIVRMSVTDTQSRIDFSSERISKLNADDDDLLARIQKLEDADNDLKIAMEILNEGPIIKYRPPFLNGLEFDVDAFFKNIESH
ncbi:hypothetical protein C2G38_2204154 [Gigaspora rosea]|uniref:Uncharacterized protein n=1 Tax=Gigaspora rosea TaxID=44941 RepID=A0A397ULY9_9GLOM|nr:hypothetical protein C2G38_2204154 [Gigaspora rosea]